MNRDETLQAANDAVNGPRQQTYGDPKQNFGLAAVIWSQILGVEVDPDQVALCMIGLKISRLTETPNHPDSWADIAGYAALGAEVASAGDGAILGVVTPPEPEPKPEVGYQPVSVKTGAINISGELAHDIDDDDAVDDSVLVATKKVKR